FSAVLPPVPQIRRRNGVADLFSGRRKTQYLLRRLRQYQPRPVQLAVYNNAAVGQHGQPYTRGHVKPVVQRTEPHAVGRYLKRPDNVYVWIEFGEERALKSVPVAVKHGRSPLFGQRL